VDGVNCTLADAIDAANSDSPKGGCPAGNGPDILTLQADIVLTGNLSQITSTITIQGNGHSVSGNDNYFIFNVSSSGELTLDTITVTHGAPYFYGGALYNEGDAEVYNSTLSENNTYYGGGVYNKGSLIISSSIITGNSAYYGGGIYHESGVMTVTNSTIAKNVAMHNSSGQISNDGNGGGIYISGGDVSIEQSTIRDNSAQNSSSGGEGGGIANNGGALDIKESTISGNEASTYGGGIYSFATWSMTDSTVTNNTATTGGGIYNSGGDETNGYVYISGCEISKNVAQANDWGGSGGGIYNNGFMKVDQSTISENRAYYEIGGGGVGSGGGVYNDNLFWIFYSTISGNTADGDGGGVSSPYYSSQQMSFQMWDCTVEGNAATHGGGIASEGDIYLSYVTISNNSASTGGGVYIDGAVTSSKATIIAVQQSGGDCNGTLNSHGYNISSDSSCGFTDPTDMNLGAAMLDLQPLADNGGPTKTMALGENSRAIDVIPAASCDENRDQRGVSRPQGDKCEPGAYEYLPPLIVHISALNDDDLRLSWTPPAEVNYYIYRGTDPYFTPQSSVGVVGSSPWQWDDLNKLGDTATNYYYIVKGLPNTPLSNRVGEFDFALTPGTQ